MAKKSRNVVLIKKIDELSDEVDFNDFKFKKYFKNTCYLLPNEENEKLDLIEIEKDIFQKKGLIYIFVIENKIFKIGQTIGSIKDRIQSYNCGKIEYRSKGTCSTTNFFILQSFLKLNRKIDIYTYVISRKEYTILGEKGSDCFPSTKVVEKKILKEFEIEHNKKPIGCTQG